MSGRVSWRNVALGDSTLAYEATRLHDCFSVAPAPSTSFAMASDVWF